MSTPASPLTGRLMSLDAYRGFIMLAMVSSSLGTSKLRGDPDWWPLAYQLSHLWWEGCTFWDLIQPSFMFMVGVSMPFAFAKRVERGESWTRQFLHVIKRCLLLCFIGFMMDSFRQPYVTIQFIRVLQQIALGYFIAFFFLHLGPKGQLAGVILLLGGHTLAFYLDGGMHAWDYTYKDQNIGRKIDRWMHHPFADVGYKHIMPLSTGFYVTFNAVSSAGTILIGVLIGELLKGSRSSGYKATALLLAGGACFGLGMLAGQWVPQVKRIWTASFALLAAGWTCWMMFFFYVVIDIIGFRRWSWPLMVVGVNSIFIYFVGQILADPIKNLLSPVTAAWLPALGNWGPVAHASMVVVVLWLLCVFLYQKRIFFKV
ncbi:MAG: DUF5009 domain-containing protein [Planctomycetes bacterium]|nr:DUF5009 domain-containing protein [Planctomycetota bacterium]